MKRFIVFAILLTMTACDESQPNPQCVDEECAQICEGRECGPSLYNSRFSCGRCDTGWTCIDGACNADREDVMGTQDSVGDNGGPDTAQVDTAASDDGQDVAGSDPGKDGSTDDNGAGDAQVDTTCVKQCIDLECGPDPVCNESCGECTGRDECESGKCVCKPYTDRECGEDGCGQLIGNCAVASQKCVLGHCVANPDDGMVPVVGGEFMMGCNDQVVNTCDSDEKPAHSVKLTTYEIDRTEVTQAEFKKCVDAGDCDKPACGYAPSATPNQPVGCVTWKAANAYCVWAGKRLPTEAEWEFAARGTDGRIYPWGPADASCQYAVMYAAGQSGCGTGGTGNVCSKSPKGDSPVGTCDMAGNVWEWVADYYSSTYYKSSPQQDPQGPSTGTGHLVRGGAFDREPITLKVDLRSTNRRSITLDTGVSEDIGFRCAR